MAKILILSLLLAGVIPASEVNLTTPTAAVISYYDALNDADLEALSQVMVQDAFDRDMQRYALPIAFNNPMFHSVLKKYGESEEAKAIVIRAVQEKLNKRSMRVVSDFNEVAIAADRRVVRFLEGSKKKELHTRRFSDSWRIVYKAERSVKE